MSRLEAREPALVVEFRDFYAAIVRERRSGLAGATSSPAAADPDAPAPAWTHRAACERLAAELARRAEVAGRTLGVDALRRHIDARYVMAALADEVLIFDVAGGATPSPPIVETRLTGTCSAGDTFFERLDRLLALDDPPTDLATVYLLALTLGFRGRLRLLPDGRLLVREYVVRLSDLLHGSGVERTVGGTLYPDAYRSVLHGGRTRLPTRRLWSGVLLVAACVAYLVATDWIWRSTTGELRGEVASLEQYLEDHGSDVPGDGG